MRRRKHDPNGENEKKTQQNTHKLGVTQRNKAVRIQKALAQDPVDASALKQLAITHGGLVSDELRRQAWPKLLNLNLYDPSYKKPVGDLTKHRDYTQVVMDVNRSLKRFPPGMREEQRIVLQDQLVEMIVTVLARNKDLHYYQGYHDICVTFLLVVGEDIAQPIIDKLSTNHLKDFMAPTMDCTSKMLNYLYPIIGKANPKVREHMDKANLGTIFALSWLITWFGHVLGDFRRVVRLYDFFIACHPLMPVYLAAAIVIHRGEDILSCECDMASIHSMLSHIPDDLPYERLIRHAGDLYILYPPAVLAKEARLHYDKSSAIRNYTKLEKSFGNQRPDAFLRRRNVQEADHKSDKIRPTSSKDSNWLIKVTVWALTAGLSASILAVYNVASDWLASNSNP